MSCVTNYILSISCFDARETEVFLSHLNKHLEDEGTISKKGYAPLLHSYPEAYGGTKILEADLAIFALNYLSPNTMREIVVSVTEELKWDSPEDIQLFVKGEENDIWYEETLFSMKKLNLMERNRFFV